MTVNSRESGAAKDGRGASGPRAPDLSIGQRLGLGVLVVVLTLGALAGTTALRLREVAAGRRLQLEELGPRARTADELETRVLYASLAASAYALTREGHHLAELEQAKSDTAAQVARLVTLDGRQGSATEARQIADAAAAFFAATRDLSPDAPGPDGPSRGERATAQARERLLEAVRAYRDRNRAALAGSQADVGAALRDVFEGCLLFALATLAAVCLTAMWTIRSVRSPVVTLLSAMRAAGAGRADEALRLTPPAGDGGEPRDELESLRQEFARMARALRAREAQFRTLADHAPDVIARYDRDFRHLFVNEAAARATGYPVSAFIGKTNREMGFPEALVHEWELRLRSVFATGQPVTFHFPYERRGKTAHFEAVVVPEKGEDGGIESVLSVARDVTLRVRAQDERRAAEERYRTLFANMTEGFALGEAILDDRGVAVDFRFLEMNEAFERQSGLAREAARGRSIREVLPRIEQRWIDTYCSVAMGADATRFEQYNGDLQRHFSVYCFSPARGRFAILFSDVTERKRAEEALRESEERFAVMFRRAPLPLFWTKLPEGIVHDVSDAFLELAGVRREEVVGTHGFSSLRHPEIRQRFLDEIAAHGSAQGEIALPTRSRGVRQVHVSATAVSFRGEPYMLGVMEDVSERRAAEAALRASEQRLRRMIDVNPIGVLNGTESGLILYANDAYLRIIGHTRAELEAGRIRWDAITPPEHLPADARAVAEARERGASDVYEKEYVRPDGTRIPVLVACATMEEGASLTAFVVDIGDRRRAEDELRQSKERLRALNEQLREADRRKDEFLGMLSHELRNPLAPIRNALFILDRAEPTSPQARRAREIATRQVAHLTRLVDDLLDVTRIARGKIELRRSDVDLSALARRAADDFRPLMQARGLELQVVAPAAPVVVNGDETRLTQVLGNLLHNASKFTPAGGRVMLTVDRDGGEAIVRVRDTGVGMDAETLETIFQPFVQARQTLARSEGGLGLGLALVKGLVTMHGGEVSARSAGGGRGTEFVVALPLDRRQLLRAHPPQEAGDGRDARRRILVVDDNQDAAETLAQLLQMGGHDVTIAHDGPSAVASALANHPDIVLCDIGLPGMDGYEVARQLRAAGAREIRLVAVSGYAQPEDVARATEAGFDAHVAKPPDPERLAHILH